MRTSPLSGGFADPARDAAHAFRAIMEAMARPGTIHRAGHAAPPEPLSAAAGAAILTLCDTDTPLHLAGPADCDAVRQWVAFHTGAPPADPGDCAFAVGPWDALSPLSRFAQGSAAYPDRSATLIVELPALTPTGVSLTGPGIRDRAALPLPDPAAFAANHAAYPLGVDFLLTAGDRIAALARSTTVHLPEAD